MPAPFPLTRVSSLCLMACSIAMAAEPVEKLALSTSEVNLLEVAVASPATAPLYAAIYSGSSSDPPGREGLAWVTAKLLARQAGPGIGVTITKEMTLFDITTPAGRGPLVRSLSRAMLKPAFAAQALDEVKHEALGEITSIRSEPARLAAEALAVFIHEGRPYGHPPCGTASGLERITLDDALAFHAAHYLKGNLAIAIAGGPGQPPAPELRSDFDAIPGGEPIRDQPVVTFLPRPAFLVVEAGNAPPGGVILAGHPGHVTAAHPDYFSLTAAVRGIVAEAGEASPAALRQPDIVFSPGEHSDGGAAALAALLVRMRDIAASGLTPESLGSIKESMRRSSETRQAGGRSPLVARLEEFLARTPGMAARRDASIDQVTVESARSAAARHLFAGRVAILAVVPSSERFIAEILASPAMKQTGVALLGPGPVRNDFRVIKEEELFK